MARNELQPRPLPERFKIFFNKVVSPRREASVVPEKTNGEVVKTIESKYLTPILDWAYGEKKWHLTDDRYWRQEEWEYKHPNKSLKKNWPEEVKLTYQYLRTILQWTSDPRIRGHLDPPHGVPVPDEEGDVVYRIPDWRNVDDIDHAVADLAKYYFNSGEPQKITPFIVVDEQKDNLLAVATDRWKGDPYNPEGRIAGIEMVMVDPSHWGEGIATKLLATISEYSFDYGYNGKGAREIRVWVMEDEKAGDYRPNRRLFRKLGFQAVPNAPHWPEYAKQRKIKTKRGDASWFRLKPEWYYEAKATNPSIRPYKNVMV